MQKTTYYVFAWAGGAKPSNEHAQCYTNTLKARILTWLSPYHWAVLEYLLRDVWGPFERVHWEYPHIPGPFSCQLYSVV